ncbi:MAG: hypothetical protein KF767_02620 [Bdellovibrionaceae bacterium]|nr:hypothetical protein [Pseudobdellovibrionaceae bacterium]
MVRTALIFFATVVAFVLMAYQPAMAQRRGSMSSGSHQFGGGVAMISPAQDDINSWIGGLGVVGTKEMGAGYEVFFNYEYRFDRTIYALHFRPSYVMQSASGGGVEAKMTAFTFFPMLRLYPLENDFIRFFFQVGLGYGSMNLALSNNTGGNGNYTGGNFGALGGLGAYFCITDSSCIVAEGTFRYLPMQRLTGSGNGLTGGSSRITQENGELEVNGMDVASTLSGVVGSLAYQYNF